MADFGNMAVELGLDVLVEIHARDELPIALALHAANDGILMGINNRDLRSFTTSLETTLAMLDDIPDGVTVVTESGIQMPEDVRLLTDAGVHAFLVGTAFMREPDPGIALRRLFG